MSMTTRPYYVFTRAELAEMLDSHIDMFVEYRDRHGRDEAAAKPCALSEMLEGLDAEHELWRLGECATSHVREGEPVSLLGRPEGEREVLSRG